MPRALLARRGPGVVLWQIPLGNTRRRALDNSWGHFQDNRVEWLLDDPSRAHLRAYASAGVIGSCSAAARQGRRVPVTRRRTA